MNKLRVALAGTFRSNFQGDMRGVLDNSIARLQQLSSESELGFDFYPVEKGMETIEDARKVKEELIEEGIDFVLIQNSSFADGDMLLPFLESSIRMGIWAVPETTESGPLPLNSICATNLYMSEIGIYTHEYKYPVKWFYGFPDDEDFIKRLTVSIRALTALKKLRETRVLMIGDYAPGFHDLAFDEQKIREMFGVGVQRIELQEFYDEFYKVHGKQNSEAIDLKSQANKVAVSQEHLQKSLSIEITFKSLLEKYDASGLAIQCWPHIPEELGIMVCSSMGRIMEDYSVAGCEGDVMGVISMLALKYLSKSDPMLMDLSAWDKKEDAVYTWHCGNIPAGWYDSDGFSLENHFNRKTTGVVREGRLKSTEVTILRLFDHEESALIATGEIFSRDKPHYKGSGGWCRNIKIDDFRVDTQDFLNTIFVNNVPHHLAFIDVNREHEIRELIQWLGLQAMEPIGYRPYLQQK